MKEIKSRENHALNRRLLNIVKISRLSSRTLSNKAVSLAYDKNL